MCYSTYKLNNRMISVPSYTTRVLEELCKITLKKNLNSLRKRELPVIYNIKNLVEYKISKSNIKYVIKTDIKDFYNSIDISILKNMLESALDNAPNINSSTKEKLINNIYEIMLSGGKVLTGSSISPYLAKIYLEEILAKFKELKLNYINYYDDFLFFCESKEEAEDTIEIIRENFNTYNLKINERKTSVKSKYDKNIFVGLSFHVIKGKERIEFNIKKSTLKRYEDKIKMYSDNIKKAYKNNNCNEINIIMNRLNNLLYTAIANYSFLNRYKQNFKFSERILDDLADFLNLKDEVIKDTNNLKSVKYYHGDSCNLVKLF